MRSAIIAVVLGLTAGAAAAGDADDATPAVVQQRARQAAEDHARAAGAATGEAAAAEYAACGTAYLDLFDAEPTVPDADQLLYNAALCFERAGDVGLALQLGARLGQQFPKSRLAPVALWQSALVYQALGMIEQAREASQRYVRLYPATPEALDAAWNVILFAELLGDDAEVVHAAASFEKLYGAKRPADVIRLRQHLAQRQAERGDVDDAIASYDALLKRYHLDADQAAWVLIERAELQWRRACPRSSIAGLCVRGDEALTLVPRQAAPAEAARKAFAQVTTLVSPRDPMTARLAARAQVHLAERAMEAVIAVGGVPPIGFDSSGQVVPASMKKVSEWLRQWQQALGDAERAATDVIALRDGPSAIAAMARLGHLYLHAAATLEQAPVPRKLAGGPGEAIYREQLASIAEPMRARAGQVVAMCLGKATELNVVTPDVADCGAMLTRAQPQEWLLPELLPPFASDAPRPMPE